jgi:hypothetical protein
MKAGNDHRKAHCLKKSIFLKLQVFILKWKVVTRRLIVSIIAIQNKTLNGLQQKNLGLMKGYFSNSKTYGVVYPR